MILVIVGTTHKTKHHNPEISSAAVVLGCLKGKVCYLHQTIQVKTIGRLDGHEAWAPEVFPCLRYMITLSVCSDHAGLIQRGMFVDIPNVRYISQPQPVRAYPKDSLVSFSLDAGGTQVRRLGSGIRFPV